MTDNEELVPSEEDKAPPEPVSPIPTELEPFSEEDERNYAMAAHVSCLVGSILGPVIVMTMNKQRSEFVERHAKEAINFQINLLGFAMASFALSIVGIGICGFFILVPAALIMPILAGVEANKGNDYRYPLIIRVIT